VGRGLHAAVDGGHAVQGQLQLLVVELADAPQTPVSNGKKKVRRRSVSNSNSSLSAPSPIVLGRWKQ
jgi:hypothetical protein